MKYEWGNLNKQQVGAFSEYFVKMEFTMHGFQVYSPEVDDQGIDFITRFGSGKFLSIQVKSIRDKGYVYMKKKKFDLSPTLFLALAILSDGTEPNLFLIPSVYWKKPNGLLVDRNYEEPEWGLNLSLRNIQRLEIYSFDTMIEQLKKQF